MRLRSFSFMLILTLNFNLFVYSQNVLQPFSLTGQIKGVDAGTFTILRFLDSSGTQLVVESRSIPIVNGSFTLKGNIAYPHAFVANIYKGKDMIPTEMFFIEPGTQSLTGNFDSMIYTVPLVTSGTNQEFLSDYWPRYKEVDKLYDLFINESRNASARLGSRLPDTAQIRIRRLQNNFINRRDSLILSQAVQHPKSFISLWLLAERFFTVGYKEIYEDGFNYLADGLKQTTTGKFLGKHIMSAKVTANGQLFPDFSLIDIKGKNKPIQMSGKKYTLLEFWFSHCGPCIAQFPDLKSVYRDFSGKGFNIIGISTDEFGQKQSLVSAIEKYQLPWDQLWDRDGTESNKITINSFPTNFLLDEKGIIIQKNINPAALRKFLVEHLN